MIISLSGRKSSGKSTLANLLVTKGYKKVSFADRLKELVSQLYGWGLDSLYDAEAKEEVLSQPVRWDSNKSQKLAALIEAKRELDGSQQVFRTRREALQFIGTEVLRSYDSDFHINEFKKRIDPEENYVMDDCRFLNELHMLKSLNAHCVFALRPYYCKYSNHISEIELNRHHFDYILINDRSESTFIKRFVRHIDGLSKVDLPLSDRGVMKNLMKIKTITEIAQHLQRSRSCVMWWTHSHLLPARQSQYDHNAFSHPTLQSSYWAGVLSANGVMEKRLKHDSVLELTSTNKELIENFRQFIKSDKPVCKEQNRYVLTLSCPYIVDDLKMWDVDSGKMPDCIKFDPKLLNCWMMGQVDGTLKNS